MSHWDVGTTAGNLPPTVPTTFQAQNNGVSDGGTAVPAGNIINFNASATNANNVNGIQVSATGSTVTYQLTNRYSGSTTTAGALTATPLIISITSPGMYIFESSVIGYKSTAPASGVAYKLIAAVLVSGGIATIVGAQDKFVRETDGTGGTTDLTAADANFTVTGANNQLSLTVTGVAGSNISWSYLGTYVQQL